MSEHADPLSERDDGALFGRAAVVAESVSEEERTVEVIASTEDIDRHGTRLKQNWRLDAFRENPVVLFSHQARELPIGTASDVRVTDGKLRAKITFSPATLNAKAEEVWQNVKAKVIRGVSVGFFPHSVRFVKENDREVVELDDNELWEISMTPVPSNPAALAQLRARAVGAAPENNQPAQPSPVPEQPEIPNMANENNGSPSLARALGLPAGASESDMMNAATRLRELEIGVIAATGVATSSEGIGAVRGLKASADECEKLRAENTALKGERDKQNFEIQVQRGIAERKLSVATAKLERDKFERRLTEGRGSEAVADLKGFIDVAPTLHSEAARQQPAPNGGESGPLSFNGKTYGEMKPLDRARLSQENPELWRAMKRDFDANAA